jgi:hypothetical protein
MESTVSHRSRSRRFILTTLLVGMQLMLMAAAGVQAQGTSFTAIPRGDVWKYQVVAHGAGEGFEAVGFDDSVWSTGQAAFGTATFNGSVYCPLWITTTTVKTSWPINTDILLRKEFSLPAGANNLQVMGDIDNNATVYINGAQIGHVTGGDCRQNLIDFTAPDSVLQTGSNIIAIRGHDAGAVNFLDVQVTYEVASTTAPCQPGTFSESGSEPCEPAPAGSFVATEGATEATLCPAGKYQDQLGQTSCLLAQAGSFVAGTGATVATLCEVGTFQDLMGQNSCKDSPAGKYVDQPGATSATDCPAGTFQDETGQTSCKDAPAGTFVAVEGATAATPCAPGFYQPDAGQTSCNAAETGSYVDQPGATSATDCLAGTYQDETGQTSCKDAPAGTFVAVEGATAATPCAPGFYQPNAGQTSCNAAPAGKYVDQPGATSAIPCPVGTFSEFSGAILCDPAPAGTYVSVEGATSATDCLAGTYQDETGQTSCKDAPAGTYVDQSGAISATDCPAGRYQNLEGQTSCNAAEAGTFVAVEGATAATPCAPGFYQPDAGQTSCIPADPGFFVDTPGAIAQKACPDGTTSAAGAIECQPIPALYVITGFYQPVDMNGVVNTVKGGSTVSLKFEVFDGLTELTDTAIVTMSVKQITCVSGSPTDAIEEIVATGGTGLRYDTTSGQFVFNWKTPKKAGACYAVTATTTDGSSVTALFKLK